MDIFKYVKDNFKIYTIEECKQLKDKGAFGFVYMTKCKVNGKLYIGQKKFNHGFKTYLGSGTLFTRAVKKHGKENFERIILEIAYSKEELNDYEIKYIELFGANEKDNDLFYNIAIGGNFVVCLKGEEHPMYGKHQSEEARKKQSEARKGKYVGEDNSMYGKHQSEEARKKQSEARKGEKYSGIKNGNAKLVVCIFPNGEIIKDICIKELAEKLKISEPIVRKILNSKQPYKVPNRKDFEYLKPLEGIIIMYYEDYLKEQNQ